MYADDTNLFLNHKKNINILYEKSQKEITHVTNWLSANKLTLNINKTKFILFNANQKSTIFYNMPLHVNVVPID